MDRVFRNIRKQLVVMLVGSMIFSMLPASNIYAAESEIDSKKEQIDSDSLESTDESIIDDKSKDDENEYDANEDGESKDIIDDFSEQTELDAVDNAVADKEADEAKADIQEDVVDDEIADTSDSAVIDDSDSKQTEEEQAEEEELEADADVIDDIEELEDDEDCLESLGEVVIDSGKLTDFGDNHVFWKITDENGKYVLTIYGEGKTGNTCSNYTNKPAYKKVTKVVVEEGVTMLGGGAFKEAPLLTDVELPNSLTELSANAFYKDTVLKKIVLPDGISVIRGYAFDGCTALTDVTLPNNLTSIENYAFRNCSSLGYLYIPATVTTLEGHIFALDTKLKKVELGAGSRIPKIPASMFSGCSALQEFDMPDTVTSIGTYAFSGCKSLKTLYLSSNLTLIDSHAFGGASALVDISIPDSVSAIGQETFYGCSRLSYVKLPSGLTTLGIKAFENCTSLKGVTIPGTLATIPKEAFYNCTSLKSVVIEDGVAKIVGLAFGKCTALTNIEIPSSIVNIENTPIARSVVIYGHTDSEAEQYAKRNGNKFVDLDKIYQIKFDGNGADTGSMLNQTFLTYGIAATLQANTYSRQYYTFNGWNTAMDGSGEQYNNSAKINYAGPEKELTLYAQWKPIDYKITYNLNGGVNSSENPPQYSVENAVVYANPTRNGYTFAGWYADSSFTNRVYGTDASYKPVSVYAKWNLNTYGISYVLNDSTPSSTPAQNPAANVATYNITQTITLRNPTRVGFTFLGWYNNAECAGTRVTSIAKGNYGDKTLYAKWSENSYTVSYNKNGGVLQTGVNANEKVTYTGDVCLLPGSVISRTGYTFTGWNTKNNGSGTHYDAESTHSRFVSANGGKITLYAEWSLDTYSITYNLNDGDIANTRATNSIKNPESYNTTKAITLVNPTRDGFTFVGWYAVPDPDLTDKNVKKITSIPKGSAGDKVFYAVWKENSLNIKFGPNGGKFITAPAEIKGIRYSDSFSLPDYDCVQRKGYTLVGWNTKANGTGKSYLYNESTMLIDDASRVANSGTITLYAMWRINVYTINYNLTTNYTGEGIEDISGAEIQASNNTKNVSTYTVASNITLYNPARPGYTFEGWIENQSGTYKKVSRISSGTIGNKEFYPKWKENSYTVKYDRNGGVYETTPANVTVKYTDHFTLPASSVLKDRIGYNFLGWNTKKDGTGIHYDALEDVSKLIQSGTLVLYAQWQEIDYSIVYELYGESEASSYKSEYMVANNVKNPAKYTVTNTVTLYNPTRTGFSFKGWYADSDYSTTKVTRINAGTIGSKTYYAKWMPNNYTVTFNANGGRGTMVRENFTYGEEKALSSNAYVRSGYTFAGWNTRLDGKGKSFLDSESVKDLTPTNGANITLYAIWTR